MDCFGPSLLCQGCCVGEHHKHPLHRIEVRVRFMATRCCVNVAQEWRGDHFQQTSLRKLGLVVQIGEHGKSTSCPMPNRRVVVVLHLNGIHEVVVEACGCRFDLELYQQFLRTSWFPATPLSPETCATFELLDLFHLLNLQGNLTVYDFFKVLEGQTDGWHLGNIPVSLESRILTSTLTDLALGPTPIAHKYDTRVEKLENTHASGPGPLLGRNLDNEGWWPFRYLSCMPTSRNELTR